MTIFICGGSNSILKGGWTRRLNALLPNHEIRNISIGATCSVTGLYRCLFTVKLSAGDTVIWEYALNDCNHVDIHGLSDEYLLKCLELMLAECAQRRVKFVALIFKSLNQELWSGEPNYHRKVKALFSAWGVEYVDVSAEYRRFLDVVSIPPAYYEEPNHYNTSSGIISYIENRAASLFEVGTVPKLCKRLHSDAAMSLGFINNFLEGASEVVGTSWFSHSAWRPSPELCARPEFGGQVLSAVMFSARDGGAFELSCGHDRVIVSATLPGPATVKPRLSPAFLDLSSTSTLNFREGDVIRVNWAGSGENLCSGTFNKRNLNAAELTGRAASLLGFLVERQTGTQM